MRRISGQEGQSTVEWIGLVLLVCVLLGGLLAFTGAAVGAVRLVQSVGERLLCAARLSDACVVAAGSDAELAAAYGHEVARTVRAHAPRIRYESGMRAVPSDFRTCREDPCAFAPESGRVWRTDGGDPVVLFTHAVDCRPAGADALAHPSRCAGERAGHLYLQYWAWYPGSATGEGSTPLKPVIRDVSEALGTPTYHPDDWESLQVRLGSGPDLARASSHDGYDYELGLGDLGRGTSWGPETGSYYVSGGSHAGTVKADRYAPRVTPADRVVLIPLEPLVASGGLPSFAVTPPWLKRVWGNPEYKGTD